MMPLTRPIIVLFLLLFLTACGVRFYYNQLDWLIPWYIRDYITLDETQKSLLEQRLTVRLDWHCSTQLPGYVVWLREAGARLAAGEVSLEELELLADQAEIFWRELMLAVAPDAAELLATASDEQIDELFTGFSTRNAEARSEFVEPPLEVQQAERVERMEQRLRRWFGRLTPEQRDRVQDWSASLTPVSAQWLENRIRWQQRLRQALERRADGPEFDMLIAELLVNPDSVWPQAYREQLAENRRLTLTLLVDLYALADERQKNRLQRRVGDMADSFERAICAIEP